MSDSSGDILTGFVFALTAFFIVLKAIGSVSWSWWIVFTPLIIYYGIGLAVLLLAGLIVLVYMLVKRYK